MNPDDIFLQFFRGGIFLSGAGLTLIGLKFLVPLLKNGKNGNGGEISAAEWRGRVVQILETQTHTLDRIANGQDDAIRILGELERRGRGSEDAIKKVLDSETM